MYYISDRLSVNCLHLSDRTYPKFTLILVTYYCNLTSVPTNRGYYRRPILLAWFIKKVEWALSINLKSIPFRNKTETAVVEEQWHIGISPNNQYKGYHKLLSQNSRIMYFTVLPKALFRLTSKPQKRYIKNNIKPIQTTKSVTEFLFGSVYKYPTTI